MTQVTSLYFSGELREVLVVRDSRVTRVTRVTPRCYFTHLFAQIIVLNKHFIDYQFVICEISVGMNFFTLKADFFEIKCCISLYYYIIYILYNNKTADCSFLLPFTLPIISKSV